jgi:type II secretory pathway component PulK
MKIRIRRNSSQGIALIIVMIVIVVLSVLAAGFAFHMKTEMRLARQDSVESDFEWLGRSGVEYARMLLIEEFKRKTIDPTDNLKQKWAGGPGTAPTNNLDGTEQSDPLAEMSLTDHELGDGKFSLRIMDAERKFNINVADQRLLQQAMITIGVDAGESPEIVDSILDWIDRDNDEHLSGAESDYYERLNPSYMAKNGWIDDMQELLLVRGMTPAIFWGTSSTNHPVAPVAIRDKFGGQREETINYPVGLYDLFTPLSKGRLNINTAPVQSLMMIPGLDTNVANAIIQHRAGPDGQDGTADDIPFNNVGELVNVGIPNQYVSQLNYYCDVSSQVFEVHVDCEIAGFRREYIALLYRMNQRDIKVLTMYWKPPENAGGEQAKYQPDSAAGW